MAEGTISVRNWDRFQHYKRRDPVWIKLHRQLLDDYDYQALPDAWKSHLVGLWLLAARLDNKIPADEEWIRNKIGASEPLAIKALADRGYLVVKGELKEGSLASRYQVASKSLADRYQVASLETETETETEASSSSLRSEELGADAPSEDLRNQELDDTSDASGDEPPPPATDPQVPIPLGLDVNVAQESKTPTPPPKPWAEQLALDPDATPWNGVLAPIIRDVWWKPDGQPPPVMVKESPWTMARALSLFKIGVKNGWKLERLELIARGLPLLFPRKKVTGLELFEPGVIERAIHHALKAAPKKSVGVPLGKALEAYMNGGGGA